MTAMGTAIHTLQPAPAKGALAAAARALRLLVEVPTVLMVVAEVVILFCGVVARYVFQAPLIWSDELASIVFLWLAMFGAAIALQRGSHMRLSYLVDRLPPPGRAIAEVLSVGVPLLFVALLCRPRVGLRGRPVLHRDAGAGLVRPGARRGAAGRAAG